MFLSVNMYVYLNIYNNLIVLLVDLNTILINKCSLSVVRVKPANPFTDLNLQQSFSLLGVTEAKAISIKVIRKLFKIKNPKKYFT